MKTERGFIAVTWSPCVLVNCYISLNSNMERFDEFLHNLEELIRMSRKPVILMGDFNAESIELGGTRLTHHGYRLATFLGLMDIVVLSSMGVRTFVRHGAGAVIDIMAIPEKISSRMKYCKVLDEDFLSDHLEIMFHMQFEILSRPRTPGGNWKSSSIWGFGGNQDWEHKGMEPTWFFFVF